MPKTRFTNNLISTALSVRQIYLRDDGKDDLDDVKAGSKT